MALEIWIHGQQTGSANTGTFADPINDFNTLRTRITSYNANDLTITLKEGARWVGRIPDEHLNYDNVILRTDPNANNPATIDGGVRYTDWSEITSGVTGKKLWQKTGLPNTQAGNSHEEGTNLTIDDQTIASRHWTTDLATTVTRMNAFTVAYAWDYNGSRMLILAPSSFNPNTADTKVGVWRSCIRNWGTSHTAQGYVIRDIIFKRIGYPINISDAPGCLIERVSGYTIGGGYRRGSSYWDGNFIELTGSCSGAIIQDVYAEGVEDTVVSPQISSGTASQSNITIRRVTGDHVGLGVVEFVHQVKDGCITDNLVMEDIVGSHIRGYGTGGMRPDSQNGGAGVIAHNQNGAGGTNGTSKYTNTVMRRIKSTDSPIAWMSLRGLDPVTYTIENCAAAYPSAQNFAAFQIFRNLNTNGTTTINFQGNVIRNASKGIQFNGSSQSLQVNAYYNAFQNTTTGFDGAGGSNISLKLQNNVFDATANAVANMTGNGNSVTSTGGNRTSTGSNAGFTSVSGDQTGQAVIAYETNSYSKPATGSPAYSGGVALTGTRKDQLGQTYPTTGTIPRGAYAIYNTSNSNVIGATGGGGGDTPPPPPVTTTTRYNRVLNANDFTSVWNMRGNTITANSTNPPTGCTTAHTLKNGAGPAGENVTQIVAFPTASQSQPITFSLRAKPNTENWLAMKISDATYSSGTWAFFNTSNGTMGRVFDLGGLSGGTASMELDTNGFYICSITNSIATSSRIVEFYAANANEVYGLVENQSIFIAGMQAEEGTRVTNFKNTTATTIASRTLTTITVTFPNATMGTNTTQVATIKLVDNAGTPWDLYTPVTMTTAPTATLTATAPSGETNRAGTITSTLTSLTAGSATVTAAAGGITSAAKTITVGGEVVIAAPLRPAVLTINSDTVLVSVDGIDAAATHVAIQMAEVNSGVLGAYTSVGNVSKGNLPLLVTGLKPGQRYRFWAWAFAGTTTSTGSPTIDATTKFLYAETTEVSTSALGVTGLNVQIWRSPTGGEIVGPSLGLFTSQKFETGAVTVGGQSRAVLRTAFTAQPTQKLRHGDVISMYVVKPGNPSTKTKIIQTAVIVEKDAGGVPLITSNGGGDTANLSKPENATAVTTIVATE